MSTERYINKKNFIRFLVIYMFLAVMHVSYLTTPFKYLFSLFTLFYAFSTMYKNSLNKNDLFFFFPFIMIIIIYAFSIVLHGDLGKLSLVANKVVFLLIIYIFRSINLEKPDLGNLFILYLISMVIITLDLLIFSRHNTNTIGAYALFLSFFPLNFILNSQVKNKNELLSLILFISFAIIMISSTRSILLSSVLGIITYFSWDLIIKNRKRYIIYYLIITSIAFAIIVIYPNLYKINGFLYLNDLSILYFGKPIFTGRNILWEKIIDIIRLKPLFGYGANINPRDLIETALSSHNLYLQIVFQVGVFGIFFLLLFFLFIWIEYFNNRKNKIVRLSASFFITILFYQIFEISLTQSFFELGLIQWVIISIGLNKNVYE